jgi:hypothetical protein
VKVAGCWTSVVVVVREAAAGKVVVVREVAGM